MMLTTTNGSSRSSLDALWLSSKLMMYLLKWEDQSQILRRDVNAPLQVACLVYTDSRGLQIILRLHEWGCRFSRAVHGSCSRKNVEDYMSCVLFFVFCLFLFVFLGF